MYSFSRLDLQRSDRMCLSIPLLLVLAGSLTMPTCRSEILNKTDRHLDCFIDWDNLISCSFESQNCSQHNLILENKDEGKKHCVPTQCLSQCCCSIQIKAIKGDSHSVSVLRGGQIEESRNIIVKENIKPKTPEITLVKESNGNFQVRWKYMEVGTVADHMKAEVMFRKKEGGEKKVSPIFKPTEIGGHWVHDIPATDLESSSTYVVSVRSFYDDSRRFSDPSEEREFKTPASHRSLLLALIFSLCLVAAFIAGAAVYIYVRVKKIWDNCPNPKVHIKPYGHQFLKPEISFTSSVSIEPLYPYDSKSWMKDTMSDTHSENQEQSSGFSTGSSCLSYANTEMPDITACQHEALMKAFPFISPVSPLPNASHPAAAGVSPAPCDLTELGQFNFENKVYSIVNPVSPPPMMIDSSEARPTQMVCVSEYHPAESEAAPSDDQGAPAFPDLVFSPAVLSSLPMDLSYQPCGADSGLSSGSSGTDTFPPCDPTVRAEAETGSTMAAKCDGDPGCRPSGPDSFLLVEDSYQSFQSLVSQPLPDLEECLDKRPAEQVPDSLTAVLSGQCLPEPQRSFFSLLSADQPPAAFTDSGYERV